MGVSQKLRRGFHRLGIFLAAIPLLIGSAWAIAVSFDAADSARRLNDEQAQLICAQRRLKASLDPQAFSPQSAPCNEGCKDLPPGFVLDKPTADTRREPATYDLKSLGCSDQPRTVSMREIQEAREPAAFSYAAALLPTLSLLLAVSVAVALAVYGIVRAIGWVIVGFVAS